MKVVQKSASVSCRRLFPGIPLSAPGFLARPEYAVRGAIYRELNGTFSSGAIFFPQLNSVWEKLVGIAINSGDSRQREALVFEDGDIGKSDVSVPPFARRSNMPP
jgi:hypothetical protein